MANGAGSPPIVGRAAERGVLSAAYASASAGQPQLLLITGEAGIGKTRLVEELVRQVESAPGGAQVRIGESAPLAGTALAYGPFVAALGEQAGWLLADDGPGSMAAARHRLFERVLGLLAGLAAAAPLVLVLEDLHWADESSRGSAAACTARSRKRSPRRPRRTRRCCACTGSWPTARTGPLPPPCSPRGRRCPPAPTRRPTGSTPWPWSRRGGCPGRARACWRRRRRRPAGPGTPSGPPAT